MPDPGLISIVVLLLLFLASMSSRVNLGLVCFPAAFLVGWYADISVDEITGSFPAEFFVLVVGVMALFAVAQSNGTLAYLLSGALRLVGGRVRLIPWLMFLVGALLTGLGTLPAAAVAMVAPIALGLAARHRFPPLLMILAGFTGVLAGCFSPIAVYGLTALQLFDKEGISMPNGSGAFLMGATVALGLLLTTGYLVASRKYLPRSKAAVAAGAGGSGASVPVATDGESTSGGTVQAAVQVDTETPTPSLRDRVCTLTAMAVLVVASVGFDVDLGYLGFTLAVILQLVLKMDPQEIVKRIPWGVVVLISGVLTYIGVMEGSGAFELIKDVILIDGSPLLGLLLLCYIAGITSFFASSIAVLATLVPLLLPLVSAGVNPMGALLAVGLACLLVDVNPLGITGGLFLASAQPEERAKLFKRLLIFGCCSTVVAPALVWALFSWF